MKREARGTLIKDIILATATWIVFGLIFTFAMDMGGVGFIISIFMAGVPFGWRWMSKVFTAISLPTIAVKFFLSVILGWLAIFVVIIGDIIAYTKAEY